MTTTDSSDPHLWLEEVEGNDALAWVRTQTAATADRLQDAGFQRDQDALYELATLPTNIPMITRRGEFVYNFWQDADHVRGIWRRTTLDSYRGDAPEWVVLLDVDVLARDEDEDWVFQGSQSCEPDHVRVLLTLSRGGADAAVVREYDVTAQAFVQGGFVVPESKSNASWVDADTLLVATTLGEGNATTSGYPRIVRRWTRGTDFSSAPVVFEGRTEDMAVYGYRDRTPGHERTIFRRQTTFEEGENYLGESAEEAILLDVPLDAGIDLDRTWLTVQLKSAWTVGGTTYPPDALLVIDADAFLAGASDFHVLFEPKPRRVLVATTWTASRLVLTVMDNLVTEIVWATPTDGDWKLEPASGFPANATLMVGNLDGGAMIRTDDLLAVVTSYLEPTSLGLFSPGSDFTVVKTAPRAFDATGLTVQRHEAIADDGERIPYFQIGRESDGPVPTVLYGYGGFNVSMLPEYLGGTGKVWLEDGNTWVVACLRGGGEFGAQWHRSGIREGKKLAHDDFAAVARDLTARGVTTAPQLACYGGSNGGLLVGNMLTRYPELFGAVWCRVPLLDMQRYTKLLAGASWIYEYGDPDVPEDWAFLQGHSAYQLVDAQRDYPPILLVTSRRDDRVHPGHARKMAAKLEAAGKKVLFYEPDDGGHGMANKKQGAELSALGFSFLRSTIGAAPGPV